MGIHIVSFGELKNLIDQLIVVRLYLSLREHPVVE